MSVNQKIASLMRTLGLPSTPNVITQLKNLLGSGGGRDEFNVNIVTYREDYLDLNNTGFINGKIFQAGDDNEGSLVTVYSTFQEFDDDEVTRIATIKEAEKVEDEVSSEGQVKVALARVYLDRHSFNEEVTFTVECDELEFTGDAVLSGTIAAGESGVVIPLFVQNLNDSEVYTVNFTFTGGDNEVLIPIQYVSDDYSDSASSSSSSSFSSSSSSQSEYSSISESGSENVGGGDTQGYNITKLFGGNKFDIEISDDGTIVTINSLDLAIEDVGFGELQGVKVDVTTIDPDQFLLKMTPEQEGDTKFVIGAEEYTVVDLTLAVELAGGFIPPAQIGNMQVFSSLNDLQSNIILEV